MKQETIRNRYIIESEVGTGQMGAVYKAYDRLSGVYVALKQVKLSTQDYTHSSHLIALTNEFRILASVRHPNIISVLDYGLSESGNPYFTMELISDFQNIIQALQNQSLSYQTQIIIQALEALNYLYRHGIIHRDIKPQNILVENHQIKVVDFGLSVVRQAHQSRAGTLAYMAPEILTSSTATPQSDLYAIGVILFELITGELPFPVDDVMSILHGEVDSEKLENHPFKDIIIKLLAKSPLERYQNPREVVRAIMQYSDKPTEIIAYQARESYLQRARFVGRDKELGILKKAFENAQQNQGSAWLIGGESGVGKTRLLDEFRIHALVNNAIVVSGKLLPQNNPSFQAWRTILPHLLLTTDVSDLEASILKEIVPNISQLLNREIDDAPPLPKGGEQRRLTHTITGMLQRQTQPLVILLEDLHYATDTIGVLQQINPILDRIPILIVATYQSDIYPILPQYVPSMEQIILDRLDKLAVTDLAISMLGAIGSHPDILDTLYRESEGNSFFLVEVVRTLAEESGGLDFIGNITLPGDIFSGGIQQILQRRIEKMNPDLHYVTVIAALYGRVINLEVLYEITSVDDVKKWLTTAAYAMVIEVHDGSWQFIHNKFRNTIIDKISPDSRCGHHQQIAEALEKLHCDDAKFSILLAHHWRYAENTQKEIHYLPIAIDTLITRSNYTEANTFLQRGMTLLPRFDGADKSDFELDLLKRSGDLNASWNFYEAAITQYATAVGIAHEKKQIEILIDSCIGMARCYYFSSQFDEAEQSLLFALDSARESDYSSGIARCLHELGAVENRQGNYEKAERSIRESIDIANNIPDRYIVGLNFNALGNIFSNLGQPDTARNFYQQSLEIMESYGNQEYIAGLYINLGYTALAEKNYEKGQQWVQESQKIKWLIGDKKGLALSYLLQARLKLAQKHNAWVSIQQALALAHPISANQLCLEGLFLAAQHHHQAQDIILALKYISVVAHHKDTSTDLRQESLDLIAEISTEVGQIVTQALTARSQNVPLDTLISEVLSSVA